MLIAIILAAIAVLGVILFVYISYRRDIREAYASIAGSEIVNTQYGVIEYATFGEGSPVLVLHGTGGGWDQGISSARDLVKHGFKLLAPSRFGYLRTPLPPDPLPPAEADTWIALLDELHIQRIPVISYSAGAAPAIQLALRYPERISAEVFFVPGSGGICPECIEKTTNPPQALLDALFRFDFPMWLLMKIAPQFAYQIAAVPSALVPTLDRKTKAELGEDIQRLLPMRPRRLGVLNEGNTQGTNIQYPLEQVAIPTLFISAADDLYKTLAFARKAARVIANARLIEFPTGGHLLLGRREEIWPTVADFIRSHQS